jgi:stalled ribosome rescue protein Dom34
VKHLKTKKRCKRGYPVAILIGLGEDTAVIWKIFSHVAKQGKKLHIKGKRNYPKDLYNFHESIINVLRPIIQEEGVRSIILASPLRKNHNQELIDHIHEHHKWLTKGSYKTVFSKITGLASTPSQITALTRTHIFKQIVNETTEEETENLIEILEKSIVNTDNHSLVLFSLQEAENLIIREQKPNDPKPEYLLLTDKYLSDNLQKNRLHRLIQIATNKKVKTRIVNAESAAGKRLIQLGSFICLAKQLKT